VYITTLFLDNYVYKKRGVRLAMFFNNIQVV